MLNLEEEIICDFKVSKERKLLWQTELEMVKEVYRICDKYGLNCFATGGTLLGAVRHKGFIPWDDDIDLGMLRNDYETFIKVAREELPEKYFLQCSQTERIYTNGHLKIRNNQTACLIESSYADLKLGKNCGVFIDIFPLDFIPDSVAQRKKLAKKINDAKKWLERYRRLVAMPLNSFKNIAKYFLTKLYFTFHSVQKEIIKIDLLAQKYNNIGKQSVAMTSFMPGVEAFIYNAEDYTEFVSAPFEDTEIKIPVNYDSLLKKQYGDYMKLPEIKDGSGSVHGKIYVDLNNSYAVYKKYDKSEFKTLLDNFVL